MSDTVTARSPVDLLAVIPYRLGFHPTDSLVAVVIEGTKLGLCARTDLSTDHRYVHNLADALARQNVTEVMFVAYAADEDLRHQAMVTLMLQRCAELEITVRDAMRTNGSRWFSYVCTKSCCPAEGMPYTLDQSPLGAELVARGMVALPSRDSVADTLAPLPEQVHQVALTMQAHLDHLGGVVNMDPQAKDTLLKQQMRTLVERVTGEQRMPEIHEVAQLALYAQNIPARDVAWTLMGTTVNKPQRHLTLWREVLRRAPEPFVTPVAALTGFAAWLTGDCVLAEAALGRVTEPYSMANLLHQALAAAIPPSTWAPATECLEGTE